MSDYLLIAKRALEGHRFRTNTLPVMPERPPEPIAISETFLHDAMVETAIGILNRQGARQFFLDGIFTIGLWRAADTPEVRHAIRALHGGGVRVLHLEDDRVPDRYRQHKPAHLKPEVERTDAEQRAISWAEWRADLANRVFLEQGSTRQAGRITPRKPVEYGEQSQSH